MHALSSMETLHAFLHRTYRVLNLLVSPYDGRKKRIPWRKCIILHIQAATVILATLCNEGKVMERKKKQQVKNGISSIDLSPYTRLYPLSGNSPLKSEAN